MAYADSKIFWLKYTYPSTLTVTTIDSSIDDCHTRLDLEPLLPRESVNDDVIAENDDLESSISSSETLSSETSSEGEERSKRRGLGIFFAIASGLIFTIAGSSIQFFQLDFTELLFVRGLVQVRTS